MADGGYAAGLQVTSRPLVEDWSHLARNMRPDEEAQFLAITGFDCYDAQQAARAMIATQGPTWAMIGADGRPMFGGGFEPERPGVANAWFVGSLAAWDAYWRSITKVCRRLMAATFESGEVGRIQVYALESREKAHLWYERGLGMKREGRHPHFYANGETAVSFARTIDMHRGQP